MRKAQRLISWLSVIAIIIGIGLNQNCLAKGKVIGLFLDGYQTDCSVIRNGKKIALSKRMELYAGDVVVKMPDVDALKIKYFAYAKGEKISKTELRMAFYPPAEEPGLLKKVQDILDFQNQYELRYASSRGELYNQMKVGGDFFTCGPFPEATLPAKGEIRFYTNEGNSGLLALYDSDKKELCQVPLVNDRVNLGEVGVKLEPGQIYYWRLGDRSPYIQMKLLLPKLEGEVNDALRQIAAAGGGEITVKLRQASYLLAISDIYPDQIEMNWLAYQLLREIVFSSAPISDEELKKTEFYLKQVYANNIKYAVE